jgi:capsular polysaccharide biosynthesis protein
VINLILAVFLGGVLGIGSALAVEMRNRRIREDEDIVEILGIPLLGKIAFVHIRPSNVRVPRAVSGRLEPSVI